MDTIWEPAPISGRGPKYKSVAESIRFAVKSGDLPQGAKLPPVRELAWTLKITPGTVARAYTILTDEGVLNAEVGRGTFVAPPRSLTKTEAPIEIDVAKHQMEVPEDEYQVNLYSPRLPSVGQAELIKGIMAKVAQDPPSGVMHYPSQDGSRPAREAVMRWLRGTPLGSLSAQDVVLTLGGQNGILLCMQAILSGRRPTVFIEELAYSGFRRAAELLRAEVVPIAMDEEGIIPEALEAAARAHEGQVLCTSPEVHNPTAVMTPMSRRREIVDVARAHNFQIMEDDCYRMRVDRDQTYRMLAPERGWYVSSIAKTISPALRLGFAIGPQRYSQRLRMTAEHSFFGLPTPITDICASLLTHPQIDEVEAAARKNFNTYIQSAVNALGGHDVRWRYDVPFLWLKLPSGWRSGAFVQAAEGQGVRVRAAEDFACRDARAPHALRLSINTAVSLRSFEAAMDRLRHLLDNPPEQIGV